MMFQLANAALLPLMGSVVTMRSSQWATVTIAACIVVPQLIVALISPWIGRRAQDWDAGRFCWRDSRRFRYGRFCSRRCLTHIHWWLCRRSTASRLRCSALWARSWSLTSRVAPGASILPRASSAQRSESVPRSARRWRVTCPITTAAKPHPGARRHCRFRTGAGVEPHARNPSGRRRRRTGRTAAAQDGLAGHVCSWLLRMLLGPRPLVRC